MFVIRRKAIIDNQVGSGKGILAVKPKQVEYQYWYRGWWSDPHYYKTIRNAKGQITINNLTEAEIIEVDHEN